ncbi:AAA family ATPase [Fulvivirgaceae bacterium PWU5]|uniref:AAA family ATPase n=1 Tax=Dawidia cretensis TaxID=2782350 RepID=A0AAP2E2G5_9BACT|nr:AAA family ATPase [Dawidia cretensis]MBT1710844.1 AAA family ATPase [Dawidia cretensis]
MRIDNIRIENFKSIVDLQLNLGRFNVLIGENGSGKSNILEAIAFGAAANANKLDYEFFGSRGIRAANPEFMFSSFEGVQKKIIKLYYSTIEEETRNSFEYDLINDDENSKKWIRLPKTSKNVKESEIIDTIVSSFLNNEVEERVKTLDPLIGENLRVALEQFWGGLKDLATSKNLEADILLRYFANLMLTTLPNKALSDFVIYSPEQSSLRRFDDSAQIYPLGIRGEGLFQYLKEVSLDPKEQEMLRSIKEKLLLLDWYEDFRLPENLMSSEFSLQIKDRYLDPTLQYFDQRSTNEGFLFLLFYSTLFTSKITPAFFAIDNIDASFNPKLCMRLTQTLVKLAKEHNKQVIVTTQNPAILDGLDLSDNDQRLFVVRRNDEGHTKVSRIEDKPGRTAKLSEVWLGGYIGGLPENF